MEYLTIIIAAIFVNNILLAQFLGVCPFLGVSQKVPTAVGMAGAVVFVMSIATLVTYMIHHFILLPLGITYLQTIAFILVIASLVQMVELVLKKVSPPLYQALGVYLPLITTNCAILGVAILVVQKDLNMVQSMAFAVGNALGFGMAMVVFAGLREHLEMSNLPAGMKGVPAALVTAGILAMAFMGFLGLV
jgi:electron transport complex protein RnfA